MKNHQEYDLMEEKETLQTIAKDVKYIKKEIADLQRDMKHEYVTKEQLALALLEHEGKINPRVDRTATLAKWAFGGMVFLIVSFAGIIITAIGNVILNTG